MVSRDGALDLRRRLLQAALGQAAAGRRPADRGSVRRPARRAARRRRRSPTRRRTRRWATTSRTPSCSRSRSSSCSRCCSSARSSPRCCRRCSAAWRSSATFFALRIVSSFADLSVFALNLVTGLGLGLAIDYSLFMVSRYREEAAPSGFGAEALRRTLQTAGRTILFSSLTVARGGRVACDLPAAVPVLDGDRGRGRRAASRRRWRWSVLPALLAVLGPRDQRARAEAAAARRRPRRAARPIAERGTGCRGS